jgi:hypothetical protein
MSDGPSDRLWRSVPQTNNHECCMSLFGLLCLCLVLGGLAFRREVRAVLGDLRLRLFGVRVRVVRSGPPAAAEHPRNSPPGFLPPPRVRTRPGAVVPPRPGPGPRPEGDVRNRLG